MLSQLAASIKTQRFAKLWIVEIARAVLKGVSQLATLLVVEDDPELLDALKLLFADLKVVCVQTLSEAHAILQRTGREIDVVVVDFRLPDGTADHLLDVLAGARDMPAVVLISGDDRAARSAVKFNVPFVRKPFDVGTLFSVVERAHAERLYPRVDARP